VTRPFYWPAGADNREELGEADFAQRLEVLADCRERRRVKPCERYVVEADNADFSWDRAPCFVHGAHDAESNVVIAA
jgi:hypothetical protein